MIEHLHSLSFAVSLTLLATACTSASTDDGSGGAGGADDVGSGGGGGDAAGIGGAGGGASEGFFTGPIAPGCTEDLAWCAEVEVDAVLSCLDVDSLPYTITSRLAGTTDDVSCHVDEGSTDLGLAIGAPQSSADYGVHEVRFWLPTYAGPGTYQLVTDVDAGDFRNMGLELQGVPAGNANVEDEDMAWATAGRCEPLTCSAVVHEGSEAIPQDPDSAQEFRLRVEITCDAGTDFWANEGGDCSAPENHCTLDGTPTLRFDVQCSH